MILIDIINSQLCIVRSIPMYTSGIPTVKIHNFIAASLADLVGYQPVIIYKQHIAHNARNK